MVISRQGGHGFMSLFKKASFNDNELVKLVIKLTKAIFTLLVQYLNI